LTVVSSKMDFVCVNIFTSCPESKQHKMPTPTEIAKCAQLSAVREIMPYITALESRIKELEDRLEKVSINADTQVKTSSSSNNRLYNVLKDKRMELAHNIRAPAYVVATNRTLNSMIEIMPRTLEDMKSVYGFGPHKMGLYGQEFLTVLLDNYSSN
jgi:superfamily II DNA helicase RecQ